MNTPIKSLSLALALVASAGAYASCEEGQSMAEAAAVKVASKTAKRCKADSEVSILLNREELEIWNVTVGCASFVGSNVYEVALTEIEDAFCSVKSVRLVENLELPSPVEAERAPGCYSMGGDVQVKIGWFRAKTFTADEVCVKGDYLKMGISPVYQPVKFELKRNSRIVASYEAWSEHYATNDLRLTIKDGEPEPTQFDVRVQANKLTKIKFNGVWVKLTN